MKGFRLLVFSFGLSVCIAGMASAKGGTTTYTSEEMGFSIKHPSSWKNANVKGGNIVVLFMGGAFNRNIQVIYDRGGEEGGRAALDRLAKILGSQKELSAEWRVVNGIRSFVQVVEWKSALGNSNALRLMAPLGDRYFLVMGVSPAGEFQKLRPLLEECVFSFKITK
jgi:hypothetical protein